MEDLVAKCVVRLEVNESAGAQGAEALQDKGRGQRQAHEISVETFPSRLEGARDDWGLLPLSSREQTPMTEAEPLADPSGEIGFFSGNPFVEVTKGILHLYKQDAMSSRQEALTLCLIGVPCSMTCHDILGFTAPCHGAIAHIRVFRDSLPNQYMCLLTFREHEAAVEFYETYNGAPFSSLEPERLCRIVWVSKVEWAHDGLPPPGHTELPTCPVCLERMDESVDGVLTILCNHAFHASCLEKWGDTTCPVCRCVQSPEQAETSECDECGKQAASRDALWICLICGHVGCGRYLSGHAASHYRETSHCYALQVGSHRVWDYKGDNFVHRLLQNKADGKLVPAEGPASEAEHAQEKVDSVQLEFTYLLTSQLEEQRMYFENKLAVTESELFKEIDQLQDDVLALSTERQELWEQVRQLRREKQALEKKAQEQSGRLASALRDLNEERQIGKALLANQEQRQAQAAALEQRGAQQERELAELKEQVRDLMFFIDAQQAVERSEHRDEIAQGSVTVASPPPAAKARRARKKK
ncbi:hypothetical protein YQE_10168, partial [Dendroctonus ponderosae]